MRDNAKRHKNLKYDGRGYKRDLSDDIILGKAKKCNYVGIHGGKMRIEFKKMGHQNCFTSAKTSFRG